MSVRHHFNSFVTQIGVTKTIKIDFIFVTPLCHKTILYFCKFYPSRNWVMLVYLERICLLRKTATIKFIRVKHGSKTINKK
jgi:hypothetical protein